MGMTMQSSRDAVPSRSSRLLGQLGLALAMAILVGAGHLAVITAKRELFGQFTWAWNTRDIGWVVPLGYASVFLPIGLTMGALSALLPHALSTRISALVWGWIGSFGLLLLYTRAHSAALFFLAMAIGVQLSRMVVARPAAWRRGVRVTTPGVAALLAVIVGGQSLHRTRDIARQRAAIPDAMADAPNIVLLIWDTVRARNLSGYGNPRPTTPFLDSLAAGGVTFEHAYSTAPWTLPSHATMMTGQYASVHGGDWLTPLDTRFRTLAEDFRDHGYETGAFTANYRATGYPTGLHRGFLRYEDVKVTWREILFSTTYTQSETFIGTWIELGIRHNVRAALRKIARFDWRPYDTYQTHDGKDGEEVAQQFLDWQASIGDRPFFAFLNMMEAHNPGFTPMARHFDGGKDGMARYDGALKFLDLQLERVVKELEARNQMRETILVLTSDHGEQFGEHGLRAHGNSLYSILLHIPLVIHAPGRVPSNVRVAQSVTLRDLRATILELSGLPVPHEPGTSLVAMWQGGGQGGARSDLVAEVSTRPNDRPDNPTFHGNLKSVLDDSLHVIRFGDGRIESYAYRTDRDEEHDLAKGNDGRAVDGTERIKRAEARHKLQR